MIEMYKDHTVFKLIIAIVFALGMGPGTHAQHDATFSAQYRSEMQGRVTYEVPEVGELLHVVAALTPFGKADTGIIDRSTDYYEEVIEHFEAYQEHPVIKKIQKELRRNRYNRLKMDACGFYFSETGAIKKDSTYPTMSFESKNWLEKYIDDLEDFSRQSDFRPFFKRHQSLYEAQIALQKEQLAVKDQWAWLENMFDSRYDSYRITFSPLVYGSHAANHFTDGEFRQSVMFIGPPYTTDKYTKKQLEGLAGRMVFTEIDHNYVNPLSDRFKKEIEAFIGGLEAWNAMKYRDYPNALSTFNEYLTYALYSLYVTDHYHEEDAALIIGRCEAIMQDRGFIRFPEFNEQVLRFYKENTGAKGEEIYRKLFSREII